MINKFLAAISHTSSGFQLSNFRHPNTHATLEVSHGNALSSWGDLVNGIVGFGNRLGAIVLEVATSFAECLKGGHEVCVLSKVEEAVAVGVGI